MDLLLKIILENKINEQSGEPLRLLGNRCGSALKEWNEKINEIKKIPGSLHSPANL
jgi:hypothetical protein